MWRQCENDASSTPGCTRRLREHLLAHLICPGRHTISGLITVFGKQFRDWSADYSLYSKDRINEEAIFSQIRKEVESLAPASRPLCVALDDTILRKTGKTIPGAAYRKDPLGPPFNVNLVWAQRRIQLSAAVADENHEVRMIPISFLDASTPRKPAKAAKAARTPASPGSPCGCGPAANGATSKSKPSRPCAGAPPGKWTFDSW